jgi:hypothetical protein
MILCHGKVEIFGILMKYDDSEKMLFVGGVYIDNGKF